MTEINTFERNHIKGVIANVDIGAAIRAKRCIKCSKISFVNYKGNIYECKDCRSILIPDIHKVC